MLTFSAVVTCLASSPPPKQIKHLKLAITQLLHHRTLTYRSHPTHFRDRCISQPRVKMQRHGSCDQGLEDDFIFVVPSFLWSLAHAMKNFMDE